MLAKERNDVRCHTWLGYSKAGAQSLARAWRSFARAALLASLHSTGEDRRLVAVGVHPRPRRVRAACSAPCSGRQNSKKVRDLGVCSELSLALTRGSLSSEGVDFLCLRTIGYPGGEKTPNRSSQKRGTRRLLS